MIELSPAADDTFRAKFTTVPDIVERWVSGYRPLRGADILDFGCGEATSALAFALNYGPRSVVGVDIMPEPERCLPLATANLGLESLPANLQLQRVAPGRLHDAAARFDLVYSWSVFEHVEDRLLDEVLQLVRSALRPDGIFFAQIAPLYYSSEGSHLMHKIPEPWGHLLNQENVYYEKLCRAASGKTEVDALWSMFNTLNRITARELIERIEGNGFRILRSYTSRDPRKPSSRLRAIFHDDVLTTNQVVVLAHRR